VFVAVKVFVAVEVFVTEGEIVAVGGGGMLKIDPFMRLPAKSQLPRLS
jgi:hypothetical protein